MLKKMMLLAVAVAAMVAFAVPAAAQAAGTVTDAEGEEATSITAVSENTISTTGLGTLDCDTVDLALTGSGGHYTGTGTAVGGGLKPHEGPCKSSSGALIDITSISATVTLDGGGTGSATFDYSYKITTPEFTLSCTFQSNGAAAVTYTPTSDSISVSGNMSGTGANCPPSGTIKGDFTVTAAGQAVSIH